MVTRLLESLRTIATPAPTQQVTALDKSIKEWIDNQMNALRADYDLYGDYYRGEQRAMLTDRLKKFIHQSLKFTDNFCEIVVDAVAERLKVTSFRSTDENYMEWAWSVWRANRMDGQQNLVHSTAVIKGDAYVLVDWNGEASQPRFTMQDPSLIIPHYNQTSMALDWISKKWTEMGNIGDKPLPRLNLYYPDRIEKYSASGNLWVPFRDEDDQAWPLPWLNQQGEPLGIPIVHFRNKTIGDDFGISELSNVVALQDVLNKTLIDLVLVLDTMAMTQRWVMNVNAPSTYDVTPGAVWQLNSDDPALAKVGEFSVSDPTGILKSIETLVQHIASVTRTPQHLFQLAGGTPSGEALKTAEQGLVHKVELRQVNFGNSWEDCMALALRVQNAFGEAVAPEEDAELEAVWNSPESRDEVMQMTALKMKSELGVSQAQIFRELGYSQDEIDQMKEDKKQEQLASTNIGAELLKQFTAGQGA